MTLIIETGAGVREANAYHDVAFVTDYLTKRGRQTENNWSSLTQAQGEAAVIAATDYMEKRFGLQLLGIREFEFDSVEATATITFSGLPVLDETFTLGDQTYKFVAVLSGAADEILIGADGVATADNTADAINATATLAGATYGLATPASRHASAQSAAGVVTLTAIANGASGGFTALQGTVSSTTFTTFSGGKDGGSQPLSFPRDSLCDRYGEPVYGVPLKWKQASAEYSVRAAASLLLPDPTYDDRGGSVKRVKEVVGPIEEEIEYVDGSYLTQLIRPYPAADNLVKEFLINFGRGGVFR